jgi:hypothetical protein
MIEENRFNKQFQASILEGKLVVSQEETLEILKQFGFTGNMEDQMFQDAWKFLSCKKNNLAFVQGVRVLIACILGFDSLWMYRGI